MPIRRQKPYLRESVVIFQRFKLQNECFITSGQHCYVIPWMGDKVVNTITALLIRCGFKANSFAGVIEIDNSSVASVQHALKEMLLSGLPSAFDLATDVPEKYLDKYDEYLPESLLAKGYGAKAYETEGTLHLVAETSLVIWICNQGINKTYIP